VARNYDSIESKESTAGRIAPSAATPILKAGQNSKYLVYPDDIDGPKDGSFSDAGDLDTGLDVATGDSISLFLFML
jgi:hypothetical protein